MNNIVRTCRVQQIDYCRYTKRIPTANNGNTISAKQLHRVRDMYFTGSKLIGSCTEVLSLPLWQKFTYTDGIGSSNAHVADGQFGKHLILRHRLYKI